MMEWDDYSMHMCIKMIKVFDFRFLSCLEFYRKMELVESCMCNSKGQKVFQSAICKLEKQ